MSKYFNNGHNEDLESLREIIEAVKSQQPSEGEWQNARRRLSERLASSQTKKVASGLPGSIYHILWGRPRARLVSFSLGTVVLLLALLVPLFISPSRISLAEVIEKTLATSFHAVWEGYDKEGNVIRRSDMYYQHPRVVNYVNGIATLFNDGEKTWLLDKEPPVIRHETPAELFAAQTGLRNVFEELETQKLKGITEIVQMPDSLLEGKTVMVWLVRHVFHQEEPVSIYEYRAEKRTGRLLQATFRDLVAGEKEMRLTGRILINYDESIPESVFAVELPDIRQAYDLALTQEKFELPGIIVLDEPDFQLELKNCLVGPRGEIVADKIVRSKKGDTPPLIPVSVSGSDGEEYYPTHLGSRVEPGMRLDWACWTPKDINVYLARTGRAEELAEQNYSATCTIFDTARTFYEDFQPRGTFSAQDFQEKITDAMLASGMRYTINSYPELEEKMAWNMTHHWFWKSQGPHGFEQYVGWLLYYGKLTSENGHPEKLPEFINGILLRRIEKLRDEESYRHYFKLPTTMILEAYEQGKTLTYSDIVEALPEIPDPWQKKPPLATFGQGKAEIKVFDAFEGPSGEIILGMRAGSGRAVLAIHYYNNQLYLYVTQAHKEGKIWKVFAPVADVSQASKEIRQKMRLYDACALRYTVFSSPAGETKPGISYSLLTFPLETKNEAEMSKWLRQIGKESLGQNYMQLNELILEKQLTQSYLRQPEPIEQGIQLFDTDSLWAEYIQLVRNNGTYEEALKRLEKKADLLKRLQERAEKQKDKSKVLYDEFLKDLERFKNIATK